MEPILSYVIRNIRSIPANQWEALALTVGVAKTLPRKLAYADRENPGVQTIQPLVTFFQQVERGEKSLADLKQSEG